MARVLLIPRAVTLPTTLAAAAVAGLGAIPHCMGMCGPLAAASCNRGRPADVLRYQAARLTGYAVLGAAWGLGGHALVVATPTRLASTLLAWSLAIGLALAALRLWRTDRGEPLVSLRRAPSRPSLVARLLARIRRSPGTVGATTALLPCGALLAAGLIAASAGTVAGGAATMLVFGATSGLGLVVAAFAARALRDAGSRAAKRALAVALALGSIVLALRPLPLLRDADPACHDAHVLEYPGGAKLDSASRGHSAFLR